MRFKRIMAVAISAAMLLMSCSCTIKITSGNSKKDDVSSDYGYESDYDFSYSSDYSFDDSSDYSSESSDVINSDEIKMGNETVGWITIDDSFYKFYDSSLNSSTIVQYCQSPYDILTLNVIEGWDAKSYALAMMENLDKNDKVTGLTGAEVTVGNKYKAYQVYCYYPSTDQFLVIWCIDSPSASKIYYIAAEFVSSNKDLIDYVETYQMPE